MKYFTLSILIILSSCASLKYEDKADKNNFSKVKLNETYVVWGKNHFRKRLTITSVENDTIRGFYKTENFAIHKNDIAKIRKNNTGATVALSYAGAAVGLFLTGVVLFKNGLKKPDR